jgi:hypothetical protein
MVNSSEPACVSSVLLMSPQDNCLIARLNLQAGNIVTIDGQNVVLTQDIPLGHKLARHALNVGDKVIRYGAPIGSITRAVATGEHIHTHNLESDYIPTYTLTGEGNHFLERGNP